MEQTFFERNFKHCLAFIIFAAAVIYGLLCQGDLVWMDEAYSFGMIRRSYADMCAITALDVHPPLFYILLKAFTTPFENKILAGKIFAVIPYLILMSFGSVQLKKIFNAKTGLAFSLLFLFFPFMQSYTAEVRMYSLGALFVFVNAVYAYKVYLSNSKKDWAIYTVFGLASAYTHYFALASTAVVYGALLLAAIIKKREILKGWIITAVITIIAYIPWLRFFVIQLKYKIDNEYWIDPITFKTLKTYFRDIFGAGGNILAAFILMFCAVFSIGFAVKKGKKASVLSLVAAAVPILTLAIGMIASFIIRPIFVIRYLLPSVPLLVAAMAIGIGSINRKVFGIILTVIPIIMGIINYPEVYIDKNTHFEGRMDEAFHMRNSDCDAYVVTIDRNDIHPGQTETVLAFYETQKDIYQVIENYGYYPFENFKYIGDFNSDKYDRVMMLVAKDKEIPKEYTDVYDYEYRETTTSLWIPVDVYLMTKK